MLGERLRKRARIKYELREYYDPTNAKIKEDVTLEACAKITQEYGCTQLIHGHTHLPGHHVESFAGQSWQRWVLSDWDLDHPEMKPRAKALMVNQETIESIDLLKTSISR
jgi:UDP-2,3-diacylglucosamine hydrolase